jgi:hypothetical protein
MIPFPCSVAASVAAGAASIKDIADTLSSEHDNAVKGAQAKLDAATKANDPVKQREAQAQLDRLNGSALQVDVTAVSAYATPVGNLVSWALGQYIAYRQIGALRSVTSDAKDKIREAGVELDDMTYSTLVRNSRQDGEDKVTQAARTWRDAEIAGHPDKTAQDTALAAFVAATKAQNQLLASTKAGLFKEMADAHDSLVAQLAGNLSLADLSVVMQTFSKKAAEFQKDVSDLQKARDEVRQAQQKLKDAQQHKAT